MCGFSFASSSNYQEHDYRYYQCLHHIISPCRVAYLLQQLKRTHHSHHTSIAVMAWASHPLHHQSGKTGCLSAATMSQTDCILHTHNTSNWSSCLSLLLPLTYVRGVKEGYLGQRISPLICVCMHSCPLFP